MNQIIKPERYLYSELLRLLCETAGRDKTILIDQNDSLTCGELKDKVDGMALYLIRSYGLQPGDRVSIVGANSIDWVLCFWAVVRAGGVAVIENDRLKGEEIARHYDDIEIKWMFVGNVSNQLLSDLKKNIGIDRVRRFDDILVATTASEDIAELDKLEMSFPERHEAIDMFTSGSTEKPKTALLSQEALLFAAEKTILRIPVHSEHHLVFASLSHILGLYRMATYLFLGEIVILAAQNSAEEIIRMSKTYSFNEISNVPTIVKQLVAHPEFETAVKPKIEYLFVGGMKLSPEELFELETVYDARVIVGYGMTETAGVVTLVDIAASQKTRYETVGAPLEEVKVKILPIFMNDPGSNQGFETGEILTKGKGLMNGYLVNGIFTSATDSEGCFHTGDIGFLDAEGYLHICGRIKNIIIKGGENIMPGEIELCPF